MERHSRAASSSRPTATVGDTPVGGTTVGAPTNVGEGNGNTSTGSLGTAQVGGGNCRDRLDRDRAGRLAGSSGSRAESGPTFSTLGLEKTVAAASPAAAPAAAPSATPLNAGRDAAPDRPRRRSTTRAAGTVEDADGQRTIGSLPFTGLDLLFAVLLGMALTARRLASAHGRRACGSTSTRAGGAVARPPRPRILSWKTGSPVIVCLHSVEACLHVRSPMRWSGSSLAASRSRPMSTRTGCRRSSSSGCRTARARRRVSVCAAGSSPPS